jgi:DNA-binding NarL/FixJ family response regulator
VLVEDQGLFLDLLGGVLAMRGGLRIVASARTVAEGKAACAKHRPGLLLLDLDLPDGSGLEVAQVLLKTNSDARVIIVSGHASDFVCPPWLDANLQAIICKNDTFASLREELDESLPLEKTPARPNEKKAAECKDLTPREAEIFALIGEGLGCKAIASHLHVSEHTVHTHRKRMARKLGTTGLELVQKAIAQRQALFSSRGGQ